MVGPAGSQAAAGDHAGPGEPVLRFGAYTLMPADKRLLQSGRSIVLGARSMNLLVVLAERAGEVVSGPELIASAWPGGGVEANCLRVHIAALRKALGDGDQGARYIVNIPGRGYLFAMDVRRSTGSAGAQALAPACAVQPVPCHMPVRSAELYGRADVVALLAAQLAVRRMVSIVGPGGIGKTSVALALAHRLQSRYPDGTCFVDLGALSDGAMLPSAVAAALGVAASNADVSGTISRFVAGRRILIVLDNCEHVADAAALLAERLLLDTSAVDLLVTSREALSLHSEWVHRLAPLAMPLPGLRIDVEQAMAYSALQLLAARAEGDGNGFTLGPANLYGAIALCHQLDGNPLAIELAAARLQTLGVDVLTAGLPGVFSVPGRASRTAFPRHQTLQTMLDWSYRLLDDTERTVFERLSCFRSAFCLDWAVRLCCGAQIGAADVIGSIASLSAKSLLAVESGGQLPRYRLLNTTRLYGQLHVAHGGSAAVKAAGARHARCLLYIYEQADADLKALPAPLWRARYAPTADDFRAALNWAFSDDGDAQLGMELTATAAFPMLELGRVDEHRLRLCHALDLLAASGRQAPELELRLLSSLFMNVANSNTNGEAVHSACARLRELMRVVGVPQRSLVGMHALCGWSLAQGNYRMVRDTAAQVGELATRVHDPIAFLMGERFTALSLHFFGQHAQADLLARRLLAGAVAQRHVHLLGQVPLTIAMRVLQGRALWMTGHPDQALAMSLEAVRMAGEQHPFAQCLALAMGAVPVALWRGEDARADVLCTQLEAVAERFSLGYWQAWSASFRPVLQARLGREPAEQWQLPDNPPVLDLLGTLSEAMAVEATVLRVRENQVGWCSAEILRARGEQCLRSGTQGSSSKAESLFLEALAIAQGQGAYGWALRAATSLARLWEGGARAAEGLALLAAECARCTEGEETADVGAARALARRLSAKEATRR